MNLNNLIQICVYTVLEKFYCFSKITQLVSAYSRDGHREPVPTVSVTICTNDSSRLI